MLFIVYQLQEQLWWIKWGGYVRRGRKRIILVPKQKRRNDLKNLNIDARMIKKIKNGI